MLEYALPTRLVKDLLFNQLNMMPEFIYKDINTRTLLYINYHPYNLNEDEILRLKLMFAKELKYDSQFIRFVKLDNDQLTPKWVNDNAHTLFMYNGLEWIEYQSAYGRIAKDPIVGATLFSPFLLFSNVSLSKLKNTTVDEITDAFRPIVNINLIDSDFYSFPIITKKSTES